jgi:AP-1 complex subunit gamma-1
MSIKLRDLIRAVRACKTAAEERAVITKECALIRTAIKEEDEQYRHRNVAKLMYIHMLGYPTHFGQMECLKLISAAGFPEKRIGYLALTLLLNEQTEVLTLVTNSLKLDLTNPNQYIQALSLIAIGNLATQDMARDLISDVEKLLRSNNSYLRKKAALATIRLLKREPDLIEGMDDRIIALLKDRSHGVLITGLQLILEVLAELPGTLPEYQKLVPSLVRLLRNFITMGYSPEHDVSGITDPFMQVKILRLLRILGKGSDEVSEQMNDVLAQVATNTETTKNAGNAILYECVQTIMDVESDSSLRVLAVNILGRFLLNRDNNIRYVALNSLSKVVTEDNAAVQRHRNTIVDCLKDPDVSIRQRALELIYQLVNEQNVVALTSELLNYLIVAQSDHKPNLASKIVQIAERYSPSKKWRVDTVITMLSIAGNNLDDSVARTAIIFIAQAEGLQGYAVHRLYRALSDDTTQSGLLQVAIWSIGEYGALLLTECPPPDSESGTYSALYQDEVIVLLERCLKLHNADVTIKSLVLNALMKLSVRFPVSSKAAIVELIVPFRHSMSLELQQRSTEYSVLLGGQYDRLRRDLLDKMPVLDEATIRQRRAEFDETNVSGKSTGAATPVPSSATFSAPAVSAGAPSGGRSLLDLDDIFGAGAAPVPIAATASPVKPAVATGSTAPSFNSNTDLLSEIFSASPSVPLTPQQPVPMLMPNMMMQNFPPAAPGPAASPFGGNDLLSLGLGAPVMPAAPAAVPMMPIIASSPTQNLNLGVFDKNGFQISMEVSKPNPADLSVTKIICRYSNQSQAQITSLNFQAAVPKYLKLDMFPPSSTTVPAFSAGAVTQEIRLANSQQGQKNIMLKLKIGYKHGDTMMDEITQVSNFPPLF